MSKTILVIIIIAVVIGGGIWVFSAHQNKNNEVSSSEINTLPENLSKNSEKASTKKIPFSEFIKGFGSYQCTVNQSVNGNETKGTIYLSKGLLRGEFASVARSLKIDTNFIVRDGYTYTWTSLMPKFGFKTKINSENRESSGSQNSGSYNFNAEKVGDYNCEAWTVDQSKFNLPTGIEFREITK